MRSRTLIWIRQNGAQSGVLRPDGRTKRLAQKDRRSCLLPPTAFGTTLLLHVGVTGRN